VEGDFTAASGNGRCLWLGGGGWGGGWWRGGGGEMAAGSVDRHCSTELPTETLSRRGERTCAFINHMPKRVDAGQYR